MIENKKILLSNGCSWVWGDGLKNPETERWSSRLSKKSKLKDVNISQPGSSNKKIIESTLNWIEENYSDLNDAIVVIGFTELTRDYFYNALLKEYQSINWATGNFQEKFSDNLNEQIGGLMDSTQDRLELFNHYSNKEWEKWWRQYFIVHYDLENFRKVLVKDMILLQSLFKSLNIPYLFFESFGCGLSKIQNKIIDKTNIVDKSFATFIHDGQLDYSDNSGHPGTEAHEEWSNYLTSCLREKYER
tara:strand:+ start:6243 stop:6980 length:738 start_codon:yes stop_codon:yes gene_type:complete